MADITKITSGTLIAAEKVEGTDVYNLQGDKLGTVDDKIGRASCRERVLMPG